MFTITSAAEASIDGVIVKLHGSVMHDAGERLQSTLAAVLADGPRNVVLDMTDLDVISSLNISELVAFRKSLLTSPPLTSDGDDEPRPAGRVVIAGAAPMIEKTLVFTRLDQLFPLYREVADALAALRGPVAAA